MDGEIDLTTADRDTLNAVIVRQRAIIERLEQRIAQLEGPAKPSGSRRMPGLKPKAKGKPGQRKGPRKARRHGFARARMMPTQRVEHVEEKCPDGGIRLSGGWEPRTREVIACPEFRCRSPSTSTSLVPAPLPTSTQSTLERQG